MNFVEAPSEASIPLRPLRRDELTTWLADQPESVTRWVVATGFEAKPGTTCLLPGNDGAIREVIAGVGETLWDWAGLPTELPTHAYHVVGELTDGQANHAALGWALGTYRFDRLKQSGDKSHAVLAWPEGCARRSPPPHARRSSSGI